MTSRTPKALVGHDTLWQLHGLAKDSGQISLAHLISDLIAASKDQPGFTEAEVRTAHANGLIAGAEQLLDQGEPVAKELNVPLEGASIESLLAVRPRFPDRQTIYAEVLKRPGNRRTSIENVDDVVEALSSLTGGK